MFKWPPNAFNVEMIKWPGKTVQLNVHCRLNEADEISGLDNSTESPTAVCLHLPPGLCLLRQLAVTGLTAKEIESALMLWAEESLPEPVDNYALDNWVISPDIRGVVAVPRAPLDQARQKLLAAGATLRILQVPELLPPADPQPAVIFWDTPKNLVACFWEQQVLYGWQSFPPGPPTRAMLEQASAICKTAPTSLHWYGSTTDNDKPWKETSSIWPNADSINSELFDPSTQQHLQIAGPTFHSYIDESENQPVAGTDKIRMGLAIGGACLAGLFLFHADISYRERQVEQLRHHVSLLNVKANRSEKLAARSGKTLRQVRELRAMTIERNGIMKVLQTLSDSLPPRVKIENISVERSGATALDGIAETEVDVSTFLERLRSSPFIRELNLSFSQKDSKKKGGQALLRFRLEAHWAQSLLTLPEADAPAPRKPKPASKRIEI